MIELYRSPWRAAFHQFARDVRSDLLIASPFIKTSEVGALCATLAGRTPRLRVLTDVKSESILGGSLDIEALKMLSQAVPDAAVIAVPRLHAKVYVRDDDCAIVTSANLTSPGLDSNHEYGVGIHESTIVQQIRRDIESYGKLGSPIGEQLLSEISETSEELVHEYQKMQRSAKSTLKRRFEERLGKARITFLQAQVGDRSAHAVFSEAIVFVLQKGPLSTAALNPRVQQLLPDLCDDSMELIVNEQRFGKRWKHAVRNAQQYLKRQGIVRIDEGKWSLTK